MIVEATVATEEAAAAVISKFCHIERRIKRRFFWAPFVGTVIFDRYSSRSRCISLIRIRVPVRHGASSD